MAISRVKSMVHTPVTCSCSVRYGLWTDGTGDPGGSRMLPEGIVSQCAGHSGHTDPDTLDAAIKRENRALNDARVAAWGAGAVIAGWTIDSNRAVVVTVRGATEALRQHLGRIDNLLPVYEG